ncbi:pantoate--beta-alanine ligase [Virgibacillus sp. W0430]|uniref:pantoate--beta-alanine ligase n=1 Tax=Virgibacillus sp. W0430 TaxID=3391580 RepID=UPI003F44D6BF
MKIIKKITEMQRLLIDLNLKQVGFVPTMGYFHEGHLTLMQQAKKDNDIVISSIFVNPLQFGPNEDFETYPRNESRDIQLAEKNGVDILFMPSANEMYPNERMVTLIANDRTDVLCGRSRPGHFDGVLTVLTKLFHIIQPDKVYFGLKDAQQVAVVDALIRDLNFSLELIGIPTVREDDGLAKSSRNVYLSQIERKEAASLYKALKIGQNLVVDGEKNPDTIIKEVEAVLTNETSGSIDYVELYSYPALRPISVINEQSILAIAVQFANARLIDNILLDENGNNVNRFK